MAELEFLSEHLNALLTTLSDAERRKFAMMIARKVRASQSQRITRQQNPDGSSYIPRKNLRNKKGQIKRKMFMKLKTAKFMKIEKIPDGVTIGFDQRVSRLARIHQDGLVDNLKYNGRTFKVRYAQRILLGFTDAEVEIIENDVLKLFDSK
ncbi:phage virion morphogenesis protein [Acinetobacter baumannii]|uniref:Phage virion morphogenesis protein n=1 Tax=Acinetobacter calcoaceticus DSM 30006 = CIP 81.8 TaxID=981331 RepID=A0ABN0K399_ACICA|nr:MULTISPECIES: phage virion morphogenesis protein [Acinetobacter]MDU6284973.1 phage virion morphogenesis protein [Acinetobacter sp.]ENV97625.1 phage virion morphogenesis protein [Acinetobacter calcoaceticus DSM 30006 = CIP 81.8]MBJ9452904.1 phage virion morphogenesis protein [Acinetobacter baumannii]MCU4561639.1 phage virion morphogenesis protein [Acinetobacter pittii]MDA4982282.1 phage virion morphogenesis protein [Acinetobacter baumannii]